MGFYLNKNRYEIAKMKNYSIKGTVEYHDNSDLIVVFIMFIAFLASLYLFLKVAKIIFVCFARDSWYPLFCTDGILALEHLSVALPFLTFLIIFFGNVIPTLGLIKNLIFILVISLTFLTLFVNDVLIWVFYGINLISVLNVWYRNLFEYRYVIGKLAMLIFVALIVFLNTGLGKSTSPSGDRILVALVVYVVLGNLAVPAILAYVVNKMSRNLRGRGHSARQLAQLAINDWPEIIVMIEQMYNTGIEDNPRWLREANRGKHVRATYNETEAAAVL